jgi:hypothetical protein
VLTRISVEPRTAVTHRNLENWEELKEFLKNTYTEKRTLNYHANQFFSTKQTKAESVSDWIQRIQRLGSKFREAALQDCQPEERAGILKLTDKLRNICFVSPLPPCASMACSGTPLPLQGLYSDRIQTIVRSRNHDSFDEIAETALEEESAIVLKNEKHRGPSKSSDVLKCSNCNKSGHVACRCYFKSKRDISVHQFSLRDGIQGSSRDVICFNCRKKGHIAKDCKRDQNGANKQGMIAGKHEGNASGNECRPSGIMQ